MIGKGVVTLCKGQKVLQEDASNGVRETSCLLGESQHINCSVSGLWIKRASLLTKVPHKLEPWLDGLYTVA